MVSDLIADERQNDFFRVNPDLNGSQLSRGMSTAVHDSRQAINNATTSTMYDCNRLLQYSDSAESDFMTFLLQRRRRRRRKCDEDNASTDHADSYDSQKAAFGHPDPPTLHMFHVSDGGEDSSGCTIAIAYTHHTVSAQILSNSVNDSSSSSRSKQHGQYKGVSNNQPIEICMLVPEDDGDVESLESENEEWIGERITCLAVVGLEELDLITSSVKDKIQIYPDVVLSDDDISCNDFDELDQAGSGKQEISPSPLIRKSWSGSFTSASSLHEKQPKHYRLAIIFGTNHSHLFTVEVKVERNVIAGSNNDSNDFHWLMERVSLTGLEAASETAPASTLFQVFPIDTPAEIKEIQRQQEMRMNNLIKRQSRTREGDEKNAISSSPIFPYMPTGGVQSLSSFRIPNQQNDFK